MKPNATSGMKYPLLLAALLSCAGAVPAQQGTAAHSGTTQRPTATLPPETGQIAAALRPEAARQAFPASPVPPPRPIFPEGPIRADSVRTPASPPSIRPPYLRPGDTVGIVTPARKLSEKADTAKVRERFESWGLKVKFGTHFFDREQPYFAGTDAQRAADLQAMIDDPGVKAVVSFQGGYGSVRLLPLLDLERLREQPKWIVGFSDVTMLHLALGRLGVESIHATMPGRFRFGRDENADAIVSDEALRSALLGLKPRIDVAAHPLNCAGTAKGRLTGGNLAIVCSSLGTPEEPDFEAPTVLFIEEIGEHMYRLDRMMQQLARSGRLARCKAILVGHFTDMAGQKHFGITDPYDIVAQYVRPLGIPVVFGLPAGHEDPNVALYMGREVTVTVGDTGAGIEF